MRIGLDYGGTKIEAAAFGPGGAPLARLRTPTPREYGASLQVIRELVSQIERETGARGSVGVALPGSVSPRSGLVRNANSTWLNGRPFESDLAKALERPVRVANDANCFALSEAVDGAGAGAGCVFGVILGTGCGGGVAMDGRVHNGASGVAGEWGHTPLPWPSAEETPGPACWCGRRGCMETWVSGTGFARWASAALGREIRGEEIAAAAAAGDAAAIAVIDLLADRLARGLAVVIDVLDPDVIVLGGGLSDVDGLPEKVAARLPPHVFSDHVAAQVVRHRHGAASGVRGAAWLWNGEEIA